MIDGLEGEIIGLTGYAGSGKDTAAKILTDLIGGEVIAYADPLRELAAAINPVVGADTYGSSGCCDEHEEVDFTLLTYNEAIEQYGYTKAKLYYPALREFLQRLATEGVRDMVTPWLQSLGFDIADRALWIRLMQQRLESEPTENRVITDVRFPNEAQLVHDFGGMVVRIERDSVAPANAHESESLAGLNEDFIIKNNGTVDDLKKSLAAFVDEVYTQPWR